MGKQIGKKLFGNIKKIGTKVLRAGAKLGAKVIDDNREKIAGEAVNYVAPNASEEDKTVGANLVGKGLREGSNFLRKV